jgi:hypothetical protein
MGDEYTMEQRLCDDTGMVSHAQLVPPKAANPTLSYLGLLNHWLAMTRRMRGDKHEPVTEPFVCTGSAHLIGEHIRCTSPAHTLREPVSGTSLNGWQVQTAPPYSVA